MSLKGFMPVSLRVLPKDALVLFVTRFTRLFAYGALSVILVFYLVSFPRSRIPKSKRLPHRYIQAQQDYPAVRVYGHCPRLFRYGLLSAPRASTRIEAFNMTR